jgi:predicted RNA-binding protein Jag
MNSYISIPDLKKTKIGTQGNYLMKSVIAQGSTIAKAIEEALKKSDSPQEFFVKILEDAQSGFLGFGSKKAKIALFFKNGDGLEKVSDSMLAKGSYLELFNNPDLKKKIDLQLKEIGLEIKPIKHEQVEKKPNIEKKPILEKKPVQEQPKYSSMQVRPLNPKPQQAPRQQRPQQKQEQSSESFQEETLQDYVSNQFNSTDSLDQKRDGDKQGYNKRRRYYRYRRNRNRTRNDQQEGSVDFSSDLDISKKDE